MSDHVIGESMGVSPFDKNPITITTDRHAKIVIRVDGKQVYVTPDHLECDTTLSKHVVEIQILNAGS